MIIDFFITAADLKSVPRQGWISKLGMKNPESVADHSYMTSLMSMVLSDISGLDTLKVVKMSLLHDIAESRTGDLMPGEVSESEKRRLENSAMDTILAELPEATRCDYRTVWDEFQADSTDEARFVHDVDKLEMALQAKIYSESSPKQVDIFYEYARSSIRSRCLQDILEKISS